MLFTLSKVVMLVNVVYFVTLYCNTNIKRLDFTAAFYYKSKKFGYIITI